MKRSCGMGRAKASPRNPAADLTPNTRPRATQCTSPYNATSDRSIHPQRQGNREGNTTPCPNFARAFFSIPRGPTKLLRFKVLLPPGEGGGRLGLAIDGAGWRPRRHRAGIPDHRPQLPIATPRLASSTPGNSKGNRETNRSKRPFSPLNGRPGSIPTPASARSKHCHTLTPTYRGKNTKYPHIPPLTR